MFITVFWTEIDFIFSYIFISETLIQLRVLLFSFDHICKQIKKNSLLATEVKKILTRDLQNSVGLNH